MTDFPFHPDYGLPDDFRLRVVEHSYAHTVRETAEHYGMSQSVIYKWRKALRTGENPYKGAEHG